jgi:hypothetical protein
MKMLEDLDEVVRLITEYESHTRDDNGCSDHPMAPHGFNRNESHNQDQYVCDCEGWQPDAASELAIARALVLYVRTHHATIADMAKRLEAAPDVDRMCEAFYEAHGSAKWAKLLDCWKDNYRKQMRAAISAMQETGR